MPCVEFVQVDDQGRQYKGNQDKVEQVLRRIDVVIEATAPWTYVVHKGADHEIVQGLDGEVVRNFTLNERHE